MGDWWLGLLAPGQRRWKASTPARNVGTLDMPSWCAPPPRDAPSWAASPARCGPWRLRCAVRSGTLLPIVPFPTLFGHMAGAEIPPPWAPEWPQYGSARAPTPPANIPVFRDCAV